jgi:hypothetical protein
MITCCLVQPHRSSCVQTSHTFCAPAATPDRTTRLEDLSALKMEADSSENAILAVSCLAPSRVAAAHRAAQCMVSVITVKRVIRSNCVNAQARGQVAAGGRNLNASPLYAANTAPACRRIEQVAAHSWQLPVRGRQHRRLSRQRRHLRDSPRWQRSRQRLLWERRCCRSQHTSRAAAPHAVSWKQRC